MKGKLTFQLILGTIITLAGLTLLFLGFYAVPIGEISSSVLVAFGEGSTFAGALIGVDYTYRYKHFKFEEEEKTKRIKEKEMLND